MRTCPFSAKPIPTTFALAPIIVPFPPRQAPRASAHQSSNACSGAMPTCISIITGIITATNGMLSRNIEIIPADQSMIRRVIVKLSVSPVSVWLMKSRKPVASSPAAIMKRPMKNRSVGHSTFVSVSWKLTSFVVKSSKIIAPTIAIIPGERPSVFCSMNPRTVRSRIERVIRINFFLSFFL